MKRTAYEEKRNDKSTHDQRTTILALLVEDAASSIPQLPESGIILDNLIGLL